MNENNNETMITLNGMAFDVEKLSGKLTGALFEKCQNMNHMVFRIDGQLSLFDSFGLHTKFLLVHSNVKF